jgi:peptide/nickel transport system substrate-binding protein
MTEWRDQSIAHRLTIGFGVFGWLIVLMVTARCSGGPGPLASQPGSGTLRVGVGQVARAADQAGLRPLARNQTLEGLVNFNEDGRPRPWLAERWTTADDGLTVTFQLRANATFHDGTPVTATRVAEALQKVLPRIMGPAFEDVEHVDALDAVTLRVRLRQPSRFLIEALDASVQNNDKDGSGTGPFMASASGQTPTLLANPSYYLGRPNIDRLELTPYPSVRAAWADLLRGNIDMLYEVTADALDSLQGSNSVSVFSFLRHYQYSISFGTNAPALESATVRRALNAAIDRDAIIRVALGGHGIPSTGPIPSHHWALDTQAPKLTFDSSVAKSLLSQRVHFTCLVPADSVYERIALAVKQQLAAASVDMRVEEATQEQLLQATQSGKFDAVLVDPISGPNLFRVYRQFYSKVSFTPKPRSSPAVDTALDRIRHAKSDDEYRTAVTDFQRAIVNDPPALFIAWDERARAVSRRFDIPASENGRDVLATIRLWRPATVQRVASRN